MLRSIRRNHSIFNTGRRNLSNQSNNALNKTSTPVKSTNRFGIFIAANLITSTGIIIYAANRITQDAEFDRYIHDSGIPFLDPFLHTIGNNLPNFLKFTITQSTPPTTTKPITSKKPHNPDNIPSSLPTPIITDTSPTTTPTTDSTTTTTLENKEDKIVNEVENEEVIEEIISTEELFAAKGHNSKEHIHPTTTDHTTTDSTSNSKHNKHIHEERLVSELYDTTHDSDDTPTTSTTTTPSVEVESSIQPSTTLPQSLPQTTTALTATPETDTSQQVILPTTSELLFRKLQSESALATTTPTTPTTTPSQYTLTNIENMTTDQLRIQLIHLTYTLNEHIQRDNNRLYNNIKQIESEYNNKYKDLLLLQRSELEAELSKRLAIQEENNKVSIYVCSIVYSVCTYGIEYVYYSILL